MHWQNVDAGIDSPLRNATFLQSLSNAIRFYNMPTYRKEFELFLNYLLYRDLLDQSRNSNAINHTFMYLSILN